MDTSVEFEFWRNLDRYIMKLQDEDKNARRSILKTIYTQVECVDSFRPPYKLDNDPKAQGECTGFASTNIIETQISLFIRPILRCTSDISEKCREISYDILSLIFDRMCVERGVEFLPIIIPHLVDKFGDAEIREPSEEVRLTAYRFINRLVAQLENSIAPVVKDIILICVNGLRDSFPEIRILTCSIVNTIARYGGRTFYFDAERLTSVISASITHQQNNVRTALITCIGSVVIYGHSRCLDPLLLPFTSRVFDKSCPVRAAFIEVVGAWMLEYNERYSSFQKFIPLLASGFYDDLPEIVNRSKTLWLQVGEKYLFENIDEYKEIADFPPALGVGYSRPSVGCKILASQHIGKLLPAIAKEIADWQPAARVKSIQLLHWLIYNCEDNIVAHLTEIMDCLFKACVDENALVKDYLIRISELIGLHVPLSVIWPLLQCEIELVSNYNRHSGALRITAAILDKVNPMIVERYMKEIAVLISQKSICHSRDEKNQICIVQICAILLKSHDQAAKEIHREVFYILLAITGLTKAPCLTKKTAELFRKLQYALKINTIEEFMGSYCGPILAEMKHHCGEWTKESADKLIFELIWQHGGLALDKNWQTILDIMVINLAPNKDPKVRLDFFTMLAVQLSENHENPFAAANKLETFLRLVIQDVLDPNMSWRAGETAAALRTAALSSLHAILDGKYVKPDLLIELGPALVVNMLPMLEEPMEMTRALVCQSFKLLVEGCEKKLGPDILHKIYPALLRRLDDSSIAVRKSACQGIATVFMNTPPEYEETFKNHIKYVYSVMVVHLEDDEIKNYVLTTLKQIGQLSPASLIEECEKIRGKQRSTCRCDQLIKTFQELSTDEADSTSH